MAKTTFKWDKEGYNVFKEQVQVKAINNTSFKLMNEISDAGVVPFDTGNLQDKKVRVSKATLKVKHAFIVWSTRYAARLFYHPEFNFKNGRIGRWTDQWFKGSKRSRIVELFAESMKKVMKW